jgi:hypothetical protein
MSIGRIGRFLFGVTATLLLMVLIGCHDSTAPSGGAMALSQNAVMVNYPNGGGTTVFVRTANPSEPLVLCTSGTKVCPECKAAAIKYFETGVLDPKCSLTGAGRYVLSYMPPSLSVN